MYTITTTTVGQLARVHELARIELQGEGWTPRNCPALGTDHYTRLTWRNGREYDTVLPLARLCKWARLGGGQELAVALAEDGSVTLREGSGEVRFNPHSDDKATLPHFTLDGNETDTCGEFKLIGAEDALQKLAQARKAHKAQKEVAAVAKLRVCERQALGRLREGAAKHCERLALLASMTFAEAVADAVAFRDARRLVRRTLASFETMPDWLGREQGEPDERGWRQLSEVEQFGHALQEYQTAKEKEDGYAPRKSWSRHAGYERDKRRKETGRRRHNLLSMLGSALSRKLGGHSLGNMDRRQLADATHFPQIGDYNRARQFVRTWAQDKARLASDYTLAREARVKAQKALANKP